MNYLVRKYMSNDEIVLKLFHSLHEALREVEDSFQSKIKVDLLECKVICALS